MFTMYEAISGFIAALNLEIAEVENNDTVLEFIPVIQTRKEHPMVYYGTIDDEFNMPDGVQVKIEVERKLYPAEIVTSDDFGVVISTEIALKLDQVYKIRYNLAWILEALVNWMKQMDVNDDRPIAQGILQHDDQFNLIDYGDPRVYHSDFLNQYQIAALVKSLRTNLTFIWGPPGTGKSRTLSEIIANYIEDGKSVLFVSQSNVAVDVVAQQVKDHDSPTIQSLREQGLLLRAGYPSTDSSHWDDVLPYSIVLKQNPNLANRRRQLYEKREHLMRELKKGSAIKSDIDIKTITVELEMIKEQVRDRVSMLKGKAPFIATTLAKLSLNKAIHGRRFDAVIVDEASMISVPSVFSALTLAKEYGVVAGDFYQLQPIHTCKHAKVKRWLGQSPFNSSGIRDRVMDQKSDRRLCILKKQYRMEDKISALVNSLFYGGVLTNASPEKRSSYPLNQMIFESRLLFIDVRDCVRCVTAPQNFSRVNSKLAEISANMAKHYIEKDIPVGIITPYTAQAKEIRKHFSKEELAEKVRVSTVHKFQGSERDVIIFEVADSFPQKSPSVLVSGSKDSFLENNSPTLPLVNVALTRAKSQVIVIADLKYLQSKLSNTNILLSTLNHMQQMGVVIRKKDNLVIRPPKASSSQVATTIEQEVQEFDQAKAQGQLSCDKCGLALRIKEGYSYYLNCPRCRNNRPLKDNDLGIYLTLQKPKCPNCSGTIWGEMHRNRPRLFCTQCGLALDRISIHKCLVLNS